MEVDDKEDKAIYKVVVDHEDQYSIWPADRENPLGWTDAGKMGTKQECFAYVEEMSKDKKRPSQKEEVERREAMDETGGERGDL